MRAVAVGGIAGILAAAQQRKLGPFRGEHQGLDPAAGVRPVAEGLLIAPPAAAPGIAFAGLQLDLIGGELRPLWRCHDDVLCPAAFVAPGRRTALSILAWGGRKK